MQMNASMITILELKMLLECAIKFDESNRIIRKGTIYKNLELYEEICKV